MHGLASGFYLVGYKVLGYRKKVVRENLRHAFPAMKAAELKEVEQKFFRHLSDVVIEVVKSFSISPGSLQRRCWILENEAFEHYKHRNRPAVVLTAHFGNWEWAGLTMGLLDKRPFQVVYHPLHSSAFDYILFQLRSRLGNVPVSMQHVLKAMLETREEQAATAFLADQTPLHKESAYWTNFMHRIAPFHQGWEKLARRLDAPVYFGYIRKMGRSQYQIELHLLSDHPAETSELQLTELYARTLERLLYLQPWTWLWSHRRWKHRYQEGWLRKKEER